MEWDYVSEMRSPTGILFIPQVIYEHGESWWNNIIRRKLLFCPPELSKITPAEPSSSKAGGAGEEHD
jgi:hypothetical protein